MANRRRYGAPRVRKSTGRRYKKAKTTLGKNFTKAVKAVVRRVNEKDAETKLVIDYPTSLGGSTLNQFVGFSQAITSSNEAYRLIPKVNQGSETFQREGNSITPKSLTLKLRCSLDARYMGAGGVNVHVFILTAKGVKSWIAAGQNVNAIPITRLLDDGQGNQAQFTGSAFNAWYPVNKNEFTVLHHKVLKLSKGYGDYQAMASGTLADSAYPFPNHQHTADYNCRIPIPAKFTYADNESGVVENPTNYCPFLVIGYTFDDNFGETITNAFEVVKVMGQTHLYFQDPQ